MAYPQLQNYLQQLQHDFSHSQLSADSQGRVTGRFYHASLSSVYQPIRRARDLQIIGYEASIRGHSAEQGLLVDRLLEQAATDDESIELDRLSRLIHTLNFFRQAPTAEQRLVLNVHKRLLAAVASGHGRAFLRILQVLGVPQSQVLLQLPAITATQTWVLSHVAENYQRNGFTISLQAQNLTQAHELLEKIRPALLLVPAATIAPHHLPELEQLCAAAEAQQCQLQLVAINQSAHWERLATVVSGYAGALVQGSLWDQVRAELLPDQLACARAA